MKILKFNLSSPATLEQIKSSKAYQLRTKIDEHKALTRDEKNWLTKQLCSNSYSKTGIPVMGWLISFEDAVKKYWVRQYGMIHECFGIDKTAIRNTFLGRIEQIVQVG